MTSSRAVWIEGPGQVGLRSERLGEVGPGQCSVRTLFSGISPGTERLVVRGRVPVEASEDMRCPHMGGEFPFPVKYGYSLVGTVEQGPGKWPGKVVHMMHPHQERCVVPATDLVPVPQGVSPRRATLAANLETAVNAVWDARLNAGERCLLVGFGTVGALAARLLDPIPGVDLWVTDVSPAKVEQARDFGLRAAAPDELEGRFDVALHTSGSTAGLQSAIDRLDFEGRVIELSWYGDRAVELHLGGRFHKQRLTLRSSQVSSLPAHMRPLWTLARRKQLVLRLLRNPDFDLHLTDEVEFESAPSAFSDLANGSFAGLSLTLAYPQD